MPGQGEKHVVENFSGWTGPPTADCGGVDIEKPGHGQLGDLVLGEKNGYKNGQPVFQVSFHSTPTPRLEGGN